MMELQGMERVTGMRMCKLLRRVRHSRKWVLGVLSFCEYVGLEEAAELYPGDVGIERMDTRRALLAWTNQEHAGKTSIARRRTTLRHGRRTNVLMGALASAET
jgi:hypothetical protein